jgi:acetylornithine deacetylase/succinyl-diaminopimelate desuccinylase-like protein
VTKGASGRLVVGLWLLAAALPPAPALGQADGLSRKEIDRLAALEEPAAIRTFRDFLRLPNDARFPDDIRRVIEWLERAFEERGFTTRRLPTRGNELLLAERHTPGAERTALIYLQADGQPVDPAAWDQESPWKPVLKAPAGSGEWQPIPWERLSGGNASDRDPEWRIFARSSSDSKGPVVQFLSSVSALNAAGILPTVHLKVIVDTEEELGSPPLPDAVERFREDLAADMLVIFDGPPHASGQPTLSFGARGIATITLTVYGPRTPQHSGHYGNYVPNPAVRLARILASMKDEHGRVTIPGYYDGVKLDETTRAVLAQVPDDAIALQRAMGIGGADSVAGSLQEALQYPSLNVRGLRAGWVGEQARTIIPSEATAEIDVRLVRESDPDGLIRSVRRHIEGLGYHLVDAVPTAEERARYPRLARFEHEVSYGAFRTEFDSEPGRWLNAALANLFGKEPIRIRTMGGSIPISPFVSALEVPAVIVPTVNPDNNQHSPNENLRLGDFLGGLRTMIAVLTQPLPERNPSGQGGGR